MHVVPLLLFLLLVTLCFLPSPTKCQVSIAGKDRTDLLEYIDAASVPVRYGGTDQTPTGQVGVRSLTIDSACTLCRSNPWRLMVFCVVESIKGGEIAWSRPVFFLSCEMCFSFVCCMIIRCIVFVCAFLHSSCMSNIYCNTFSLQLLGRPQRS